ncbi:related to allantoate transport protein [Rhynchosporium agropyri]|uniref:Related to allantoate transport protein n=1 Tax=Rhynchosporium agropyri TaxID=914238 RepID=A0A1E1L4P1_9HELO|nr:related to allantoate transport protein [Rhynchosporium agropyri]
MTTDKADTVGETIAPNTTRGSDDVVYEKGNHSSSGDIAGLLVDTAIATAITPEQEAAVLRRVDMFLVPVMFLSFALQYMDKACLTGAALFGILPDLDLIQIQFKGKAPVIDTSRYSYASLIFYWGYLLGLLPGVYFSQRFPLGKYVAITMFLWGGTTVCTVAVNSYQGLYVQRFFLGFTEAGIAPAFSLITAMWWKRQEQPLRYAVWYSSVGLGTLVGTLIMYAIGQINGDLAAWRYQFMIIGTITSLWGVALWFLLPDSPLNAYFLTKEHKVIAVERLRWEQIGLENKTIKIEQIKEALTDPKTWFYVSITFLCNFTNGAVTGFGSIIVKSFGFPPLRTILLLGGAGVWAFVFLLVGGVISCYVRNTRSIIAIFCCLPVIAGAAMVWQSDSWSAKGSNKGVPLWGFYMMAVFSTTYVIVLALKAANTAGHTKKAFTAGLVWASYCVSNGIAPVTVLTQEEKQHYPTAFTIILVFMSLTCALLVAFRFYLEWLNKKRDALGVVDLDAAALTGFNDTTDLKNENFRFQT